MVLLYLQVSHERGRGRFYHTKEGNVILEAEIWRCYAAGFEVGGRGHKPRTAHLKAGKSKEMDSLCPRALGMAQPTPRFRPSKTDFGFLSSRAIIEYLSVILSHQACGKFLQHHSKLVHT